MFWKLINFDDLKTDFSDLGGDFDLKTDFCVLKNDFVF